MQSNIWEGMFIKLAFNDEKQFVWHVYYFGRLIRDDCKSEREATQAFLDFAYPNDESKRNYRSF